MNLEDVCMCPSCRRTSWMSPMLNNIHWTGDCTCKGQDWDCFILPDNWLMNCPECGTECSASSAPSIDGVGYGHIVWECNWKPCGWWWG